VGSVAVNNFISRSVDSPGAPYLKKRSRSPLPGSSDKPKWTGLQKLFRGSCSASTRHGSREEGEFLHSLRRSGAVQGGCEKSPVSCAELQE